MWHRHKYKVRSVKQTNYVRNGAEVTVILKVCSKRGCDKINTEHINGHWSEQELLGR